MVTSFFVLPYSPEVIISTTGKYTITTHLSGGLSGRSHVLSHGLYLPNSKNISFFSQYGLSSIQNGLMFIISGGTYAVIAPGVGRLCDKWVYPKKMLTVGALFIVTSYVIIGPFPYLMIPKYEKSHFA